MRKAIETLKNIWKIEDLRQRILITILFVAIYRFGSYVVLPGINPAMLAKLHEQTSEGLLALLNMFSGGAFSNASIFALGIMPYISASIVIQLLGIAVPYFQKLQREGESGRRKMNQYTRYLTIAILLVQAPSYLLNLKMQAGPSLNASLDWTLFMVTSTIILAAGSMFILWLGERITDKGIGNGISFIILIGIIATWVLGMICQATGIYVIDPDAGYYSLYPTLQFTDFTAIKDTFGQCFTADFSGVRIIDFIVVLFSFLFVDMFDTIGTLIGVSDKAGMLDEKGQLPNVKQALLADAVATSAGAIFGTSTTTTFVESSAGVGAGARTGLASVVTGFLFLLAIFFAPIFTAIPGFATAPALIFVGFLMVSAIVKVNFDDLTDAIPAYLCLIAMPLMYSIAEGIAIGVISYVILNLVCGKHKKITPLMYILAVLFICKYIFL